MNIALLKVAATTATAAVLVVTGAAATPKPTAPAPLSTRNISFAPPARPPTSSGLSVMTPAGVAPGGPFAHAASASPAPEITWGQKDWDQQAINHARGQATVFFIYAFHVTSASWAIPHLPRIKMRVGYWPFATHPLFDGEKSWIGYARTGPYVNYMQGRHQTITVRAWDHKAFTKMVFRFTCTAYIGNQTCTATVGSH